MRQPEHRLGKGGGRQRRAGVGSDVDPYFARDQQRARRGRDHLQLGNAADECQFGKIQPVGSGVEVVNRDHFRAIARHKGIAARTPAHQDIALAPDQDIVTGAARQNR